MKQLETKIYSKFIYCSTLVIFLFSLVSCKSTRVSTSTDENVVDFCIICHGNETNSAPPRGTHGETNTTDIAVGAHQSHLTAGTISDGVECSECHIVPNSTNEAGHIDTSLPAEITWGPLATLKVNSPSWNREDSSCSNTYCHGATLSGGSNKNPIWTTVDGSQISCDSCHGNPPPAPHPQSDNCYLCHNETVDEDGKINILNGEHIDGNVQASGTGCSGCHGNETNFAPPKGLNGETDSSQIAVGAHQEHLSDGNIRSAIKCSECHIIPGSVDDTGHIDSSLPAEITWGSLATSGDSDPTWDRNAESCSNVYCHGSTLSGGLNNNPIWTKTDGSQISCDSCHGNPPPAPHPQNNNCNLCHPTTVDTDGKIKVDQNKHIDGNIQVAGMNCNSCHGNEVNYAPPKGLNGETQSDELAVGAHQEHLLGGNISSALSCDECHNVPSSVDDVGHIDSALPAEIDWGIVAIMGGANPTWDRDAKTCSSVYCHGATLSGGLNKNPIWTTVDNSQISCDSCHGNPPSNPHPQNSNCNLCHPSTVDQNGAIDIANDKHIDGAIQAVGMNCSSCHGNETNFAPPKGLNGETDSSQIAVGAHQKHLTGGIFRAGIACTECHINPSSVDDVGHIDSSLPAEIEWGTLAIARDSDPSWDRASSTCSNTYCHGEPLLGGNNKNPVWTQAEQTSCGSCHGNPPPTPHTSYSVCSGCHPNTVNSDGTININSGYHMDGGVQAAGVTNKFVFSGPSSISAASCEQYTILALDLLFNPTSVSQNTTVQLLEILGSEAFRFYSNNTCTTSITKKVFLAGSSSEIVYIKDNIAEDVSLVAKVGSSFVYKKFPVTITSDLSYKLRINGKLSSMSGSCSDAYSVLALDQFDNLSPIGTTKTIILSVAGQGVFYKDPSCNTTPTTSIIINADEYSSESFYIKDNISENIIISASTSDLVDTSYSVNILSYLKASNVDVGDFFGQSVAISGSTMVIGAPKEDTTAVDSGAVYIFVDPNHDGDWSDAVEQAILKASNADDNFGSSVAISGSTIVVGAYGEDSNGSSPSDNSAGLSGAAYIFVDPNHDGNWSDVQEQAYLKASNAESADFFGFQVAISDSTIVIGAYGEDSNGTDQNNNLASSSGAVYVFVDPNSDGNWSDATQQAYLKASNAEAQDIFGFSVAISGSTIVVGASQEDSKGSSFPLDNSLDRSGAAYIFTDPNQDGNWTQQKYLKASNPDKLDLFGVSVAISGSTIIIGAPNEDGNGTSPGNNSKDNAGAAYIFVDPNHDGNWSDTTQQVYLKSSVVDAGDAFGRIVSISNSTIAIGAYGEDSSGSSASNNSTDNSGAAYIFVDPNNDGNWSDVTQKLYLKAMNADVSDNFSISLYVNGSTIAVGANMEDSDGSSPNNNSFTSSGAVYVGRTTTP